jgi:hypothetical protein
MGGRRGLELWPRRRGKLALTLVLLAVFDAAPVFALGDGTIPGAGIPLCQTR